LQEFRLFDHLQKAGPAHAMPKINGMAQQIKNPPGIPTIDGPDTEHNAAMYPVTFNRTKYSAICAAMTIVPHTPKFIVG
jgi:hypothetical protein